MIYINNELIDYSYKKVDGKIELINEKFVGNPIVEWIAKGIDDVKKELPMVIEFAPELGVRNANGIIEYPQSRPIPIEETITKFGYSFTIRWSSEVRKESKNGYVYIPRRNINFGAAYGAYNGMTIIGEDKADLAFFLKEISRLKGGTFIIRDEVKNAMEVAEKAKNEAILLRILPFSDNKYDDKTIKLVAESYGFGNADYILSRYGSEEGMIVLRTRLYERIKDMYKRDSSVIDEFSERIKGGDLVKALSLVSRAENAHIISLHDTQRGKVWKLSTGDVLCPSASSKHQLYLASFLLKNPEKYEMLKELVDGKKEDIVEGNIDYSVEVNPINELRAEYHKKFGKNPPPKYINDIEWIQTKLNE